MPPRRRCVSSAEAVPAKRQITKPCTDCPWRRDSLPGWLGGASSSEWVRAAHGEDKVPCHVHGNVQCAGLAVYRANTAKSCRDSSIIKLPKDKTSVFASPAEFINHHTKGE